MSTLGSTVGPPRAHSIGGSRQSVYSTGSTLRTVRTNKTSARHQNNSRLDWWKKPLVKSAFYTDLQKGSWHIGFYSLFVSIFTTVTSAFDIHCLDMATPGSKHTGWYLFSYEFVYVGNHDVRNLLMMSSVFSLIGGIVLVAASIVLLDGLRREDEKRFRFWLWTMGIFAPWKIIAWVFGGIVNDMIFIYNVLMLILWALFNIANCLSWVCIYSLYLELSDVSHLQDLARLKMETMSGAASRAASQFGSRPTSPNVPRGHHINPPQPHLGGGGYHYAAQGGSLPINNGAHSQQSSVHDPLYATRGQVTSSDIY